MKVSRRSRRAFDLYVRVYNTMGGCEAARWPESWEIVADPNGESAAAAFMRWESTPWRKHALASQSPAQQSAIANGTHRLRLRLPCYEPHLLHKACQGKQILGFQIGQWETGIVDGVSCVGELQDSFPWMPEWVWSSLRGQVRPKRGDWEFDWLVASPGLLVRSR